MKEKFLKDKKLLIVASIVGVLALISLLVGGYLIFQNLNTYTEEVTLTESIEPEVIEIEDSNLPDSVLIESGSKSTGSRQVIYEITYKKSNDEEVSRTELNSEILEQPGTYVQVTGTAEINSNDDFKEGALFNFAETLLKSFNENNLDEVYDNFYPVVIQNAKIDKEHFINSNTQYPFFKQSIGGELQLPFDKNTQYSNEQREEILEEYLNPRVFRVNEDTIIMFTMASENGDFEVVYSTKDQSFYYINYETEYIRVLDESSEETKTVLGQNRIYKLGVKQTFSVDKCSSLELSGQCIVTVTNGYATQDGEFLALSENESYLFVMFANGDSKDWGEEGIKIDNVDHLKARYYYDFGQDPLEYKVDGFEKYFEIDEQVQIAE